MRSLITNLEADVVSLILINEMIDSIHFSLQRFSYMRDEYVIRENQDTVEYF